VYPPQDNPHAERIHSYIQKFKEDFTTELFQWYIQHGEPVCNLANKQSTYFYHAGEVRTMFEQEAAHAVYMDAFFRERPNAAISWIHDLGKASYGSAASALLKDAENATNLEGKHVRFIRNKPVFL